MEGVKTQGNFMVHGPDGERRAAFALESDRDLFLIAEELRDAFKLVMHDVEETEQFETVAVIRTKTRVAAVVVLDKIWAMEGTDETTG
jgi:hypothetical protein